MGFVCLNMPTCAHSTEGREPRAGGGVHERGGGGGGDRLGRSQIVLQLNK